MPEVVVLADGRVRTRCSGRRTTLLFSRPKQIPYGIERYGKEAQRLYGVLDKRLSETAFVGGDEYSIADMAIWPWARFPERQNVDTSSLKNFRRWFDTIAARPATTRAQEVLSAACA